MPKNIVILSDGTGQEGGRGHDTNIYKLFRLLEDRTERQIVFYDQGLGTDWRKVSGNAFGSGFSRNILQSYSFIHDNYESGDRLYLLGFSRGAATVRSLANFIHYFGILPKARPELIPRAWKLYKSGRQERIEVAVEEERRHNLKESMSSKGLDLIDRATDRVEAAFRQPLNEKAKQFVREHPNQWASIEFMGVWDTVPALGLVPLAGLNVLINNIPWWKHRFHDFKLHPSIKNAYHALSIDDDRLWFHPTIWKECNPDQVVQQVWFSGAHTDVGGGFMAAGLSDLSLEWMLEKAVDHGIRIRLDSRPDWNFVIAPEATERWHPPRSGITKVYAFGLRDTVWDRTALNSYGPPKLHRSVLERAEQDPNYRPWILTKYGEYLDLLPGRFADWLEEEHLRGYDLAFERYAEYVMSSEAGEAVQEPPASREEWLAANPFTEWLADRHPTYIDQLRRAGDNAEMRAWLERYPPYTDWLESVYPPFTKTAFGDLILEPYVGLYQYIDAEGVQQVTSRDLPEEVMAKTGWTDKREVQLRDYDRESLAGMIERGLDHSERGAQDNLIERLILVRPIVEEQPAERRKRKAKTALRKWTNRSHYDRERWYSQKFKKVGG